MSINKRATVRIAAVVAGFAGGFVIAGAWIADSSAQSGGPHDRVAEAAATRTHSPRPTATPVPSVVRDHRGQTAAPRPRTSTPLPTSTAPPTVRDHRSSPPPSR